MTKLKAFAVFNMLCFLLQIFMAYLVQTGAFNSKTISEVSATYESLFTPDGKTFIIWSLIYILLGMSCLYHIIIAYKHDKQHPSNADLLKMGNLFILVNLAAAAWLWAWVHEYLFISVVLIYFQLLCLISIHSRINMYDPLRSAAEKLSLQVPISVYLGWMSIASIANSSAYLTSVSWDGFGIPALTWSIIMIGVAMILSLVMIFGYRNIYFGLTVAWGLYGIGEKRSGTGPDSVPVLVIATGVAIALLLLSCIIQLVRNINYKPSKPMFPASPMQEKTAPVPSTSSG